MTAKSTNAKRRVMTGPQFRAWREARGYSLGRMADLFGVTKSSVQDLDAGGCSQIHALAMAAIDHGVMPYTPDPEEASNVEDQVAESPVHTTAPSDHRRTPRRDARRPPAVE